MARVRFAKRVGELCLVAKTDTGRRLHVKRASLEMDRLFDILARMALAAEHQTVDESSQDVETVPVEHKVIIELAEWHHEARRRSRP